MSVVEKEDEGYCQPADSFLTDTIYLSVLLIILTLFLNASCFPDFSVSLNWFTEKFLRLDLNLTADKKSGSRWCRNTNKHSCYHKHIQVGAEFSNTDCYLLFNSWDENTKVQTVTLTLKRPLTFHHFISTTHETFSTHSITSLFSVLLFSLFIKDTWCFTLLFLIESKMFPSEL